MAKPQLLPEELFEDEYTDKFKGLVRRRGLIVKFRRDRARLDLGLMLTERGTVELSGRKVWFQLKGVHHSTVTEQDLARRGHVPVEIRIDDLRFWYAAPEATYLVVYVEAIDRFLAEDVRDIVDREWGVDFLQPDRFGDQETITVHVPAEAVLDERSLDVMLAHRSMRIDGPAFRGRPLGHRLDPLRCALDELDPDAFDRVVDSLLDAYWFRDVTERDATRLITGGNGQRVRLLTGTLHTTYEYPLAGSVEIGVGADGAPRGEGQFFTAFGRAAVVVHSTVVLPFEPSGDAPDLLAELADEGFDQMLVFRERAGFRSPLPVPRSARPALPGSTGTRQHRVQRAHRHARVPRSRGGPAVV